MRTCSSYFATESTSILLVADVPTVCAVFRVNTVAVSPSPSRPPSSPRRSLRAATSSLASFSFDFSSRIFWARPFHPEPPLLLPGCAAMPDGWLDGVGDAMDAFVATDRVSSSTIAAMSTSGPT